jgi:hypothetical protein
LVAVAVVDSAAQVKRVIRQVVVARVDLLKTWESH